jgi:putative protease
VPSGTRVWKTDDPALNAELQKTWKRERLPRKKLAVQWSVSGAAGAPMVLRDASSGCEVLSAIHLESARQRPFNGEYLKQQLGRLGETSYELTALKMDLEGEVMLPVSELNRMRRALVEQLDQAGTGVPHRVPATQVTVADLMPARVSRTDDPAPELRVLCRNETQVHAALACGIETIYVDLEDVRRCKHIVATVRREVPEAKIYLATPRIQKAGEVGLFRVVERALPDGMLVRNLGGLGYFRNHSELTMIGDFSLNVANPISAALLMEHGVEHVTVSYDLNIEQVLNLLAAAPPEWFELTLHQHMPMFHMEHCVFCAFLSKGTDFTNCGRPCDKHEVQLRDRVGQLHPLKADVGCRNTLFNGRAQSGARFYTALHAAGLRKVRVELLEEDEAAASETIRAYQDLLAGLPGEELWSRLQVDSRLGVVEGTLVKG